MTLSARGRDMAGGGLAPYIRAHVARREDPAYTSLAIAENHHVFPLIAGRLERTPPVDLATVSYGEMAGGAGIRTAVAQVLGDHVFGRDVDPVHVQVLAGASGVLEALANALCDPGDGILVPTPSYAGFWPDLEIRPGVRVVEVPTDPAADFRLTPAMLDAAIAAAGVPVRALLLTNPDNPRGQVIGAEDVDALVGWAVERGLHVIADEIYALSVHDGTPIPSVGRRALGEQVHVVWAVSKDLGMSGLRTGVLVSENEELRRTIELQATWGGVSGHTQLVLADMLGDRAFMGSYLEAMRSGLASMAADVTAALSALDIPVWSPSAGFFLLCDLRAHLDAPTEQAEHRLWSRLLEEAGVNLTPGSALRSPVPGLFRVCYAANPRDRVLEAIGRVGAALA